MTNKELIAALEAADGPSRELLEQAILDLGDWADERSKEAAQQFDKHYALTLNLEHPDVRLQLGRQQAFRSVRSYASRSLAAIKAGGEG